MLILQNNLARCFSELSESRSKEKVIRWKWRPLKDNPWIIHLLQGRRKGEKEPINIFALKCPVTWEWERFIVQPLMPFSESAILDLNPVAFKGAPLSKLDNRQVVFAGLWTPQQRLWRPGDLFHPWRSLFVLFLSLNLFQSYYFSLFYLKSVHTAFFCRFWRKWKLEVSFILHKYMLNKIKYFKLNIQYCTMA